MPIDITGKFTPSGGAGAFKLYDSRDMEYSVASVTIASDEIAVPTADVMILTGEGSAADTLSQIDAGYSGQIVTFIVVGDYNITFDSETGATPSKRLVTSDSADALIRGAFTNAVGSSISFQYFSSRWREIGRNLYTNTRTIDFFAASTMPTTTTGATDTGKIAVGSLDDEYFVDFTNSGAKEYAILPNFLRMPIDWDGGTVLARVIWTADSTSTNSVVWGVALKCLADGDALTTAWGTAGEVTDANGSSAYTIRQTAATSAITVGGTPAGGNLLKVRIYRDSANASDNLAATARLIGLAITYTTNRFVGG